MFVTRKMVEENILETNNILYKRPNLTDINVYDAFSNQDIKNVSK